jgi:CubicO group peptidase (beta-lactamase class C family)
MLTTRAVACAVVLALALTAEAPAVAQPAASAASMNDLAGLWTARRAWPHAEGQLLIRAEGNDYTADFGGRTLPVRRVDGELVFTLPDEPGEFRGKHQRDGSIFGLWRGAFSSALYVGARYVTPVRLAPDGRGRWRGPIAPFDDEFTMHLLLTPQEDGSAAALLRNLDRDYGAQIGVQRLERRGEALVLVGMRRNETASRDLAQGSFNAETGVLTFSFPNRGGSYDFRRDGETSSFYPRPRNQEPYVYAPPPALSDGWRTASLEDVDIDRARIEAVINRLLETPMDTIDATQIHGLLIARRGRLVLEEYFHGQSRDRLHETRSASKSVTATIVGAVIEAGLPLRLSSPVFETMVPERAGAIDAPRRAMTLENLLTMSSGFFCDDRNPDAPGNENTVSEQTEEPDYYRFSLAVPLDRTPGERAVYCSSDANLALGMVGRATGEHPLYAFERLIAQPMQIRRYAWGTDPSGNPYGGGSAQFLPRDFMKFGQLMLDGGEWNGRRILSREFAARASSGLYDLERSTYGYLWWSREFPYRGRTVRSFSARGAGGQLVNVFPELDLVIAIYGGNYASLGYRHYFNELIPNELLPAVEERRR